MNFELSLILIQTITGLFSLYLGYKAIDLNQKSYKNSNDCYINTGIHNQTYIENTSTKYNEIIEKRKGTSNIFTGLLISLFLEQGYIHL
ncbi:hypothetical protein K9E54_009790 [Staphylococcus pseudintermedius]|nr:hypothetical protein K9E54_009790 [Staphylococcus pseudintermedius]